MSELMPSLFDGFEFTYPCLVIALCILCILVFISHLMTKLSRLKQTIESRNSTGLSVKNSELISDAKDTKEEQDKKPTKVHVGPGRAARPLSNPTDPVEARLDKVFRDHVAENCPDYIDKVPQLKQQHSKDAKMEVQSVLEDKPIHTG